MVKTFTINFKEYDIWLDRVNYLNRSKGDIGSFLVRDCLNDLGYLDIGNQVITLNDINYLTVKEHLLGILSNLLLGVPSDCMYLLNYIDNGIFVLYFDY